MRTPLIVAIVFALLCALPASSLAGQSVLSTSAGLPLGLSAEEEAEEGQEGEDPGVSSPEAEAAASAEAEAEEEGEQAGGLDRSRSGHGKSSHSTHGGHVAVVSQLGLTAKAKTALRQRMPAASSVAFSFTLSSSATLQVTLIEQTIGHGRARWIPVPDSIVLGARKGRGTGALSGHNRLSPGRYRLTVKPAGGRSRSITVRVL